MALTLNWHPRGPQATPTAFGRTPTSARLLWAPSALLSSTRAAAAAAAGGGGGGSGAGGGDSGAGGGGGGSGRGGSDDEGDDDGPSPLSVNIWVLAVGAAAALGIFQVSSKKLRARGRSTAPLGTAAGTAAADTAATAGLCTDDVKALTRLTQEAFAELVAVKARLLELEEEAGIKGSGSRTPSDASPVSGRSRSRSPVRGSSSDSGEQHHPRHRLSGVVRLGGGLLWTEDGTTQEGAAAAQAAGVRLNTDALLQLSALVRGGRDSVHAECRLDPAANRLALRKLLYSFRLGSRLRLVLSPFGARGRDAAYTLNPLAGQGLTSLIRHGSPLHSSVLGSLAGVALEAPRAWLSGGYFARAAPGGVQAHSLLAQAVVAPTLNLSAGLTYLEHRADTQSAAAAGAGGSGGDDSGGPVMVGALERAAAPGAAFPDGTLHRQLGALLAWRLGDSAVVHGWASADADDVERCVRDGRAADVRPKQWGLLLGPYPDGSGSSWALGVGHLSAAAPAGMGSSGDADDDTLRPNLAELSLQHSLGDGLVLSPGLVVMARRGGGYTALMGARTSWAF